jgi:hypothetical protein
VGITPQNLKQLKPGHPTVTGLPNNFPSQMK